MPEYLRALFVILALATTVFVFAKAPVCALASTTVDFERRRNLWFVITLAAFLAHNIWIFFIVAALLLLFAIPREPNKLALFFFLLFAVSPLSEDIPGLGVVKLIMNFNYFRLLSLTILLPAFLFLKKQQDNDRFGRSLPDKLIVGYLAVICILILISSTFTHALRAGVIYPFIDVFLPYYVASRSLKSLKEFRDVLVSFILAGLVLCVIGIFEYMRHWLLYSGLSGALGVTSRVGMYLERGDGVLRAQATAGHAIALGYIIAVAIGFFIYLKRSVPNKTAWSLGLLLMVLGLFSPLSRGPWVGAAVILLVFVATSPSPGRLFMQLGGFVVVIVPVLLLTSEGEKLVQLLPFVGSVSDETITYRQRLLEVTIQVILQKPFFGAYNYMYSPELEDLRQGHGIIDIVNSYIGVALSSGLVGLSLFSGFFMAIAAGIFKAMRSLPDRSSELYPLGQVLLSTLLGIMIIIFTVSSIFAIPVIYWAVAGLGVAYARMIALAKTAENLSETASPSLAQPASINRRK